MSPEEPKNNRTHAMSDEGEAPLTRLQRIVTGETSKAAKLKNKLRPNLKSRIQKNRKSRTSGKLALMLQMPMEVFCEIAGHLNPLDLLHLSRSTKGLRDLLMSRTARLIWRSTMRAMEIPESPGDINEPQLVSLLFETFCQGCGAPRVKKVDYSLRVRLCPGCFSLNVVQGYKVVEGFSATDYAVYRLCCFERAFATGPLQNGLMTWPDEIYARQKFFVPDLTDAIRQYQVYDAGSREQKLFLEHRKELATKICEHAIAIQKWEYQQSRVKANDEYSKIESRKKSILKRLKELGYTDEDLTNNGIFYSSEWNNIFWQPRELSERIWKNILPQLEAIIATRRRKRAEQLSALRDRRWTELRRVYRLFCVKWKNRKGTTPRMLFEDLQKLPEVKALIDRNGPKASIGEVDSTEVESMLTRIIRDHETRTKANWVAPITFCRKNTGLFPPLTEPIPDTSFMSVWEEFSLSSPSIYTYEEFLDLHVHRAAIFRTLNEGKPPTPTLTTSAPSVAWALSRSLGLDEMIIVVEIGDLGPSFVCKCCNPVHRKKMTWNDIVNHFEYKAEWSSAVPSELWVERTDNLGADIDPDHSLNVRADFAELDHNETSPRTAEERTATATNADAYENFMS